MILKLLKVRKNKNQIKCFEIKTRFFEIKDQMLRQNNKLAFSKGVYSIFIDQDFVSDGQISP